MPIYQYKCDACNHQFEALQKMSDAKLVDCPNCNLASLKKQLTAAAFKLKGTGWYETDFKNSGAKPQAKSVKESSSAKKSSTEDSATASPAPSNSTTDASKSKTQVADSA